MGSEIAPQVVAHRGSSAGAPENAVESLAGLPPFVSGVEVDVALSRDGVPVLMHDRRVDRTTEGNGAVEDLTYAELRRLTGVGGVRVPRLADYLAACALRDFQTILVDVKSSQPAALEAITSIVRGSSVAGTCMIMVRSDVAMAWVHNHAEELQRGFFGVSLANVEERVASALKHDAAVLFVTHGDQPYLQNRRVVGQIKAAGLLAGASIVNTTEAIEAARVDGCDFILTDRSEQLHYLVGRSAHSSSSLPGSSPGSSGPL